MAASIRSQNKFLDILRKMYRSTLWMPTRRYFRYSSLFTILQSLFTYHPQEKMLMNAFSFLSASHIEGDYLEFGVYEGWNFVSAYHLAKLSGFTQMRFYAFDSFSGLPEIAGVDADGYRQYSQGDYSCDINNFKRNIKKQGVDLNKTHIIPGWFEGSLSTETKEKLSIHKAAMIWIDCDLYQSTVPVLNFITSYLQDGCILVFDDWFAFRGNPGRGEQRAFHEWLEAHPNIKVVEFLRMGWHGNSFIIQI